MRIFLLSCHAILETDWLNIWTSLGHYVFSPGAYVEPNNQGDESLRPKPPLDPKWADRYREDMEAFHRLGKPGIDNKELLTDEFCDRFDVVVLMHLPRWAHANAKVLDKRPWVWATIGQSVAHNEAEMKQYWGSGNMRIVRYSPMERNIPGYIGESALIRFGKSPEIFKDWDGETASVVCVGQSLQRRGAPCNWKWLNEVSAGFPRTLYGPESETCDWGKGKLPFDDMRAALRKNRVAINGGTWPASVVLSAIEQLMTGIPLVLVGPKLGQPHGWFPGHDLYEGSLLVENGVNGWCSDDLGATRDFIKQLLGNHELAKKIGAAGRQRAIELFGIDKIAGQWDEFFKSLN